ncbi:hypothetical protein DDB_G0287383 [Dictyostelium discoideum AX4]|uniref:Uncharacterized protein n=1 Tax=Dictyostelium discoideum TaxID=44689 RepID=Q54KE3_DICDI|nr:hypothetical protein DDB_G0287383 [Dictyostelium discoideum AX4]EAL63759.1 hypothetical protein DDB_G0287383 [Dictyostelium discoideum AX4]|eukprot:XP_637280.1 hypothetical protein DDB_G0287383 [Dictyostelium discoideum AX4]
MKTELKPTPTITTVPDEWFESLLRHEGISTLNNTSDTPSFFILMGEMKDLKIPSSEIVLSKHYILKTIFLKGGELQVNFPSPKVKVFVGYFKDPNNRDGELTVFLLRELEQTHTFNVLQRHIENPNPINGLQTDYESFNHLLQFIQEHHNEGKSLWEIDPTHKYDKEKL